MMKNSAQRCAVTDNALAPIRDATLLARVQARGPDCEAACSLLLERHRGPVHGRCLQRLGNVDDADDALQETLLKAARGMQGFAGRSSVRTWLFAIADNECWSLVRRQSRYRYSEHIRGLIQIHEEHQRRSFLSDDEQSDLVNATLKQLPPNAREVLGLCFFGDASFDEIAQTLGISLSAAKMRLYRALDLFAVNYPNAGTVDVRANRSLAG